MGEVGRNQGRWKLLGTEKWLTAHYENSREESNLFIRTAFSSLVFSTVSNTLKQLSLTLEAVGLSKVYVSVSICCLYWYEQWHIIYNYQVDSVADEERFGLKFFSKINQNIFFCWWILIFLDSSLGQNTEFDHFSRSSLEFSENNFHLWNSFVIWSAFIWVCYFDARRKFNIFSPCQKPFFTADIFAVDEVTTLAWHYTFFYSF